MIEGDPDFFNAPNSSHWVALVVRNGLARAEDERSAVLGRQTRKERTTERRANTIQDNDIMTFGGYIWFTSLGGWLAGTGGCLQRQIGTGSDGSM